jgi:hypothetical protein
MKSSRRNFLKHVAQACEGTLGAALLRQVSSRVASAVARLPKPSESRSHAVIVRPKGINARAYSPDCSLHARRSRTVDHGKDRRAREV